SRLQVEKLRGTDTTALFTPINCETPAPTQAQWPLQLPVGTKRSHPSSMTSLLCPLPVNWRAFPWLDQE
ncbi:MAG: hypothetical protein Q9180_003429, partial [Flavoplaca navasiana]